MNAAVTPRGIAPPLVTGPRHVRPAIFAEMNDRTARQAHRARRHAVLRTLASAIGGGSLLLGMLLAAWVQADGPARARQDYQRACEVGAECGVER